MKKGMKATREKLQNSQAKIGLLIGELTATAGAALKNYKLAREACPSRKEAIDGTVEALTCGRYNTIGVLGPEPPVNADVVDKVSRRVKRDGLFDVVVMATVSDEPNNRRIQGEIAKALGLTFDDKKDVAKRAGRLGCVKALLKRGDEKDESERANMVRERILREEKVLVILHDLCRGIDLDEVGIPYGAAHPGCMLLLTSASEQVLSEEMHAQKIVEL